jgi:hypothetical protein
MKKLLTIATIAATLSGISAFGQGYFAFSGNASSVWTSAGLGAGGVAVRGPAVYDVALLWASGSGVTPLVDSIMPSVPTNYAGSVSATTAWNDILTDGNFQLAYNNNGSTLVSVANNANGSFSYNGATSFPVSGTGAAGGPATLFLIAWSSAYATPAAAALAGSVVGWSAPFNYSYTSSIGTPLSITASGFTPFGVAAVPEPATMALVGLGGLSLLLFRRRK